MSFYVIGLSSLNGEVFVKILQHSIELNAEIFKTKKIIIFYHEIHLLFIIFYWIFYFNYVGIDPINLQNILLSLDLDYPN